MENQALLQCNVLALGVFSSRLVLKNGRAGLFCAPSARGPMISKVIYFVDGWVRTNIGAHACASDAELLVQRCIDDAAKAGFTNEQLEEDLGTDLLDFLTSELEAREMARANRQSRPVMRV